MFAFLNSGTKEAADPLVSPKIAAAWLRQLPALDVIGRQQQVMRAFDAMPALEPSAGAGTATPRIFELRTYESHSDRAALNKLKMFNAGEIPIFRRAGLTPVFFGETVIGAKMPSLTYMLVFANLIADISYSLLDPRIRYS